MKMKKIGSKVGGARVQNFTMQILHCFQIDSADSGGLTVSSEEPDADPHIFKCPLGIISGSTDVSVTLNYSCELPPEGQDTRRLWMPDLSLPGKFAHSR